MDVPASGGDQGEELLNLNNLQNITENEPITNVQSENVADFLNNIDPSSRVSAIRNNLTGMFGNNGEDVSFSMLLPIIWKNLIITGKAYFVMLYSLMPTTELFYYLIRYVVST